jgi:Flp pilus assembly pilin Flp
MVTVLRTFLRFLQARVDVAAAEVLVLVTLTAVVAVLPVNKH